MNKISQLDEISETKSLQMSTRITLSVLFD